MTPKLKQAALNAEELKQYNRAYENKDNFLAKGQINAAWNKMTDQQKTSFMAHVRKKVMIGQVMVLNLLLPLLQLQLQR